MYFQARLLQPRQAATKAGMNRLHVVTVFNFPGAARNARRNGNIKPIQHKYLTNFRSNYFLYPSLKRFFSVAV